MFRNISWRTPPPNGKSLFRGKQCIVGIIKSHVQGGHLVRFGHRFILSWDGLVNMADKGVDSGEEEEPTIAEDVVVTKYKMAGDMANRKYQNGSRLIFSAEKIRPTV